MKPNLTTLEGYEAYLNHGDSERVRLREEREISWSNHMNGPCIFCGAMDYALSFGGPDVCPSCDCGNFGIEKIKQQRLEILELRKRLAAAQSCPEGWVKLFEGCDRILLRYPVQPKSTMDPSTPVYVTYSVDEFKAMLQAAGKPGWVIEG